MCCVIFLSLKYYSSNGTWYVILFVLMVKYHPRICVLWKQTAMFGFKQHLIESQSVATSLPDLFLMLWI